MTADNLLNTLFDLLALDSPSGREEKVADYTLNFLKHRGFSAKKDATGNAIGFLPGKGEPILLTAHMDRVPPGKGHIPVRDGDILRSDGTTNLGTDDAAGIVIILEAIDEIIKQDIPHPPLVVAFTVQEEVGLQGARSLDLSEYNVKQGIGYDNAFEAGTLISSGSTYEGFDIEIHGKPTHPGKDLSQGINALKVFLETDWMIGLSDNDQSRINIGLVTAGTARNVVPGSVQIQGELRTTIDQQSVAEKLKQLEQNLKKTCEKYSATYTFTTHRHSSSYEIDLSEPLVQLYKKVVEDKGREFVTKPTFVGSDANALRAEKGLKVFTLATGVKDEHTKDESVKISDLVMLTEDLIDVITALGK